MKEADKLDLRKPTPPPVSARPPVAEEKKPVTEVPKPAVEPREEQPQPEKKIKKRGGLAIGVVVGVLATVAVLLAGYRFVHSWSDPTCIAKAQCSICGLEKEGYAEHTWQRSGTCEEPECCTVCGVTGTTPAGHDWTGGSCTEPRSCAVCGAVEDKAPGHPYLDGFCTVCGAEQVNEVLKWKRWGYDAEYTYDSETGMLAIRAPGMKYFEQKEITIKDYADADVNDERYTVTRDGELVTVNLPADLAPGRYTVCAGFTETEVADFYYGTVGEFIPEGEDIWYEDFEVKSWSSGLWLAQTDTEVLLGVQTEEEAARFGSPWQLCQVKYSDTDAVIVNDLNAICDKFHTDKYVRFEASGREERVYVFQFEKWYLAMDAEGTVYLTDTLTDECWWYITSSL